MIASRVVLASRYYMTVPCTAIGVYKIEIFSVEYSDLRNLIKLVFYREHTCNCQLEKLAFLLLVQWQGP